METLTTDPAGDGATHEHQRVARLQMALARLGLFALESVDVPALIDESLREIVRQLDVDCGLVLRMRPDDGDALVIGASGFPEELRARDPALPAGDDDALAAHALDARTPFTIEDWSGEERFERPALFEEQGVQSSAFVRIAGRSGPYGLLCACAAEAAWREALETGEPFGHEFRLKSGEDDTYRWFLCRAVPMEGRDGDTLQWYGTNTDITRQKEDAIEHRRLAAVVENASDFIGSFNLDGEVIFLNDAGCVMVGLEGEEAARRQNFADFHPDDEAAFLNGHILPTVRSEGRWRAKTAAKTATPLRWRTPASA